MGACQGGFAPKLPNIADYVTDQHIDNCLYPIPGFYLMPDVSVT